MTAPEWFCEGMSDANAALTAGDYRLAGEIALSLRDMSVDEFGVAAPATRKAHELLVGCLVMAGEMVEACDVIHGRLRALGDSLSPQSWQAFLEIQSASKLLMSANDSRSALDLLRSHVVVARSSDRCTPKVLSAYLSELATAEEIVGNRPAARELRAELDAIGEAAQIDLLSLLAGDPRTCE